MPRNPKSKDENEPDQSAMVFSEGSEEIIYDDQKERLVRANMRELRKTLRKGAGKGAVDGESLKSRDRFARAKSRALMKTIRSRPVNVIHPSILIARFQDSPILDSLYIQRSKKWVKILDRPRRKNIATVTVKNFSFLDNPNSTLLFFKNIAFLECRELSCYINFDDDYIHDIGSYLVFSEIWSTVSYFAQGGRMAPPVQRVLSEIGIGREMNIKLSAIRDGDINDDIWTMPVERRRPLRVPKSQEALIKPQAADIVAQRFGDLVNSWLGVDDFNAELTDDGMSKLKGIFGELLDNGVRHSILGSDDGNWSMGAFMARRPRAVDGKFEYLCRIAVLSLGQSIADSFVRAPKEIGDYAENYAKRHQRKGQSKDTLKTLLALQDMITTDPSAWKERGGGTGLMATIEFFHHLAALSDAEIAPRMTIVSGASCIMLKDPHIVGRTPPVWTKESAPPRQLWCNERNTIQEPPDMEYVFDLDERFAGTLITMGFALDSEWLRGILETENGGKNDD